MAWDNTQAAKFTNFKIFVVKSIDCVVEKIEETYTTGVRDFVCVPINEARRAIERKGNGYYIATDNPDIAKQYGMKLVELKYQGNKN